MGHRLVISPGVCLFLALMILLVPLRWVLAIIVAVIVHELCHMAMMCLFWHGGYSLRLRPFGAGIPLPPLTRGQEVLCAMAGPLGSLSLVALRGSFPCLAICGLVQGIWNLMPIYPLDGGRILVGLLSMAFPPPRAKQWATWIEAFACITLLVMGIYGYVVLQLGFLALIPAVYSVFHSIFGKTPCKAAHLRVQ